MKAIRLLAFACASCGLAVIAMFTLVSTPSNAEAVIWDLSAKRSNTAQLFDLLDRLGHEKPRPFAINGNKVWVATARSSKTPRQVLSEYQHALAVDGLNPARFESMAAAESPRGRFAALTGGLVPTAIEDDYIAMGGVLPSNGATTAEELGRLASSPDTERFKAFRSIEAFREPGSSWTTVIAVVSDEQFDYAKMIPGAGVSGGYDADVPACPGCVRVQKFEDLSGADHSATMFSTLTSRREIRDFYRSAMTARGWVSDSATDSYERIDAVAGADIAAGRLAFTREGRHIAITLLPHPQGGTLVDVRLRR